MVVLGLGGVLVRRPTPSHLPGDCLPESAEKDPRDPGNRGQVITSQRGREWPLGKVRRNERCFFLYCNKL